MKNQALFSSKDRSKKLKCRLLRFLFCALRVKSGTNYFLASFDIYYSFYMTALLKQPSGAIVRFSDNSSLYSSESWMDG